MIMTKEFIEWCKTADDDTRMAMFNFVIYTFCGMKIPQRVQIAYEIIRGKEFCINISKDQKSAL